MHRQRQTARGGQRETDTGMQSSTDPHTVEIIRLLIISFIAQLCVASALVYTVRFDLPEPGKDVYAKRRRFESLMASESEQVVGSLLGLWRDLMRTDEESGILGPQHRHAWGSAFRARHVRVGNTTASTSTDV